MGGDAVAVAVALAQGDSVVRQTGEVVRREVVAGAGRGREREVQGNEDFEGRAHRVRALAGVLIRAGFGEVDPGPMPVMLFM
jgi:hypothetical protein